MQQKFSKHMRAFPSGELLELSGNLGKPADFTWRDYLLMLLKIDAGIEHGLMVQYLYAAYSLGGDQVPEDQRDRVRRWQQTILSIAKEEMGHLMTVQNVITCMGGAVSLDREDYPWDHEFYPFPFELEPLTLDSLAKYVYTEAPLGWGEQESETKALTQAIKQHKEGILKRVMEGKIPPRPDVKSVAALFKVVLEIIKDPARISDDDFHPETFAQQASWGAWARNHGQVSGEDATDELSDGSQPKKPRTCPTTADVIVVPVATRDDVINALEQVAEQGEAAHSSAEKSHFARFLHIYEEFSRHFPENSERQPVHPQAQPARDLPINPSSLGKLKRQDGDMAARNTPIKNKLTCEWASLFDLRYRLLLTYLTHTFRLARGTNPNKGAGTYQALTHRTFGEMYNLKALAEILVRAPLDEPGQPFKPAGPTFQMPYTLELPENAVSCWLQYRDILDASENVRLAIRDLAGNKLTHSEQQYLAAMANADRETERWLETVMEAAKVASAVES
ncbi:MAG: hypothetical protein H6999_00360 [Hahellaceae bacterium]|nr:hypothetical protein [Hahellaceae bacterium]MCP5168203.1 hypothetical protein [Hahellaceae bacterium]